MSWSRRGLLLALPAAALAGCGFTPAYAPSGPGAALFGATRYDVPATPEGFWLRARLQERLGSGAGPYGLAVTLTLTPRDAALSPSGQVVRRALRGAATWALTGPEGELATGEVSTFTAWSSSGSTVAVQTAEEDARERLARALADLVVTEALAALAGP
ncbi:LPS assembly lipoprotein LptE [Pseudoroseicyclus sp. CXY001]|uniref:LPS assembly lipoprotein LptE n=1 Tax=Pseudoroseicyclus sp. CXY001 TaxID=3242492 RepID=UPI003570ABF6